MQLYDILAHPDIVAYCLKNGKTIIGYIILKIEKKLPNGIPMLFITTKELIKNLGLKSKVGAFLLFTTKSYSL